MVTRLSISRDIGDIATTTTEYDKNSNITATIDAETRRTEFTYDTLNRRIETKDALNKITTYSYDKVGNLKSVTDANSHTTNYIYDGLNRPTKTINALAQSTDTTYDLVGNIKSVKDATGHLISYDYDGNNRRIKTSDERGVIQTIVYNEVGLVKTVKDAIGNTITNTYDNRNRLTHSTDAFGADTETKYYANGNILATIDGEYHRTDYIYDANNRRTKTIKTVNSSTFSELTTYDEIGNILATTDGENHTTTYEYDDANRRIKTIDPLSHTTLTKYDKVGNIVKTTDALGRITESTYDKLNRQLSITQAFGTVDATTTSYGYDDVGNLTIQTDGRTHPTTYTYDELNRQIQTTDIYSNITNTEYYDTPTLVASAIGLAAPAIISPTNVGKIVNQIDALNHSTLSVYDLQGRLIDTYDGIKHRTSHQTYYNDNRIETSVDTFGQTTNYSYLDNLRQTIIIDPFGVTTTKTSDKVGNLIETTDTESRTTKYDYDELNRQTKITDAVGGITTYTYDNNGKTKSVKDAVNNTTSYTYDAAGRLIQEHSALGNRTIGYDNVNNQTSAIDRNGRITEYDYDNLNRVKTELWVGNGKQFTYTYDQNSNLTSADDGSLHYDYTYDYTDLLIRADRISGTSPIVSFKYDYDSVGNLTTTDELIAGSLKATTTYQYNSRNLNTELSQTGVGLAGKRVKFTYDTQGQTTKVERYLGATLALSTTNAYDVYGRLTGITQTNSSGVIIADSLYGFDHLSRLISETIDGVNRLIDYDKVNQVKVVSGSNSEAYSYDDNGNRTNTGYVTGVNNQLSSDGVYNYLYDGEGNRTKRTKISDLSVDEYVWDYRNRLVSVVSKNAAGIVTQTVGYEYDVDDQRVKKTVDGVVENYYLDGNQIAFVTDGGGNQTFHYLYGLNVDSVMAQDSTTGMVWSLADRLGTVDTLTDAGGVVVDKRTFDSFGGVLSETNPSLKFRYGYTGREQDKETGLDYYRARYYDAANGRFISVDPAGFGAGDTNLYRYVGNSSTNYTDPTGELAFLPLLGMAAMGVMNALIDVNVQLAVNNMTDKTDMNWASVGVSFGTGMLGFGLAQRATQTSSLAWKIAANPLTQRAVDSGIDGVGKVVENTINGKPLHNELFETVAGNFVFGSVAEAGIKGAGALAASAFKRFNGTIGAAHISMFSKEHLPFIENGRFIYEDEALVVRAVSLHQELGYTSNRTLAVGRARHQETGEYVTLYSSSTSKIEDKFVNERGGKKLNAPIQGDMGEIAVNVRNKEYNSYGFGEINGVHQSHAELNMIQWAQKNDYIIEGIGVSHNGGVCPECYAQMVLRGITTSNPLYSNFSYINRAGQMKIPALPTPMPEWWTPPKISFSAGNGIITIDPVDQLMHIKTSNIDHSINLNPFLKSQP